MTGLRRLADQITPRRGAAAVLAAALVLFWRVGHRQWFIRDDWAFLLTRRAIREDVGIDAWLFTAQDGHWMTPPLAAYWLIERVVGIDSYWPYLLLNMSLHVAAVACVVALCRRYGVQPWTTVLVGALLLVFGSGWENVVFAVQITYNLSLVAFFAHLLLVDHDGPVGRRDAAGSAVAMVGVSSSAFGPFFVAAVFAVLAWRRRWRAALVAAVPSGVVYTWWLLTWGDDRAGEAGEASLTGALKFARLALTATLNGMTGQVLFAGAALFGIVVVVLVRPMPRDTRALVAVLAVSPVPVMLAIGWQRAVFGLESAASSRYLYMSAVLLALPFAMALDELRSVHRYALPVGRVIVLLAVVSNARLLVASSDDWADRSARARDVFELVAGSPATADAPGATVMVAFDPDVTVAWLPRLVEGGAIVPRTPSSVEDVEMVERVLAGTPEP